MCIRDRLNADGFAKTLSKIKRLLKKENVDIFINVRTDTFILLQENRIEETTKRIELYVKRISMGNFIFDKMYNQFEKTTQNVLKKQSFNSIF